MDDSLLQLMEEIDKQVKEEKWDNILSKHGVS